MILSLLEDYIWQQKTFGIVTAQAAPERIIRICAETVWKTKQRLERLGVEVP